MITSVFNLKLCKKETMQEFAYFLLYLYRILGVEHKECTGNFWGSFLFDQGSFCLYLWINQIFIKVKSDRIKWSVWMQLKFIPLSFLIACFYWKFRKPRFLLKKCIAMNPENRWVNNFCLKVLYSGFILFLQFSIWNVITMNI